MTSFGEEPLNPLWISPCLSRSSIGFSIAAVGQLIGTFDAMFLRLSSPTSSVTDVWKVIFWRFSMMAMLLACALLAANRKHFVKIFCATFDRFGLAAAISTTCCQLAYTSSLQIMSAANTIVVFASCPIVTAVLSRLLLGESVPCRLYVTISCAFSCVLWVFIGEIKRAGTAGFLLAFLSALAMAIYSTACYKASLREPSRSMLPSLVLGAVLTALIACASAEGDLAVSSHDLYWFFAQALVLPLWICALTISTRYITPAEVNIVLLMDPILGPIWVWIAGFEAPPKHAIIGGIALTVCLFFHGRWSVRRAAECDSGGLQSETSPKERLLGA